MTPRPHPSRPVRRHRRTLLVLVALITLLLGPAPRPAAAAPDQAAPWRCDSATDVMVVVDYQELGGGIVVGCATDSPRNGLDALRQAGFRVDTTVRFPGFLCRIDGKPASDPCHTASPADAYWSYWLAPRGGRWCYANFGAGNRSAVPGTVEGWSFSKDKTASQTPPPGVSPPSRGSGSAPGIPASDCTSPTDGAESAPTTTTTRPRPTTTRPSPSLPGSTRPGPSGSAGSSDHHRPADSRPSDPSAPADGESGRPADPDAPGPSGDDAEEDDPGTEADSPDDDRSDTDDATEDGDDEDGDEDGEKPGGRGRDRADAAANVRIRDRSDIDDPSSGGSPWGLILTGVIVAATAVGIAIRRRTAPPPS